MNIIQLYQDYGVAFLEEGHSHCRPGWVNTPCPYCTGNPGWHLGFNIDDNFYTCWRCGWHPPIQTISKLINLSFSQTAEIVKKYKLSFSITKVTTAVKYNVKPHLLPSNTMPLLVKHKHYLRNRGFDADYLEKEWNLVGTNTYSKLDNIDYKFRIIIPFIWDNQQVSFDSRDITDKHGSKYMACPKEREIIPHKNILYGKQEKWESTGICVEGPTDVWRFGTQSFAVSGIKYTPSQVKNIARIFTRVHVCFDDDPQASIQANKIVAELKFRGVDAFRVKIKGDPGSMKQDDADYLVKQLMK